MVNKNIKFNKEKATTQIKKIAKYLLHRACLDLPIFKHQFIVETDVSDIGIG